MARIFIVEDDPLINDLVTKNLERVGHTCTSAFEGTDAECILRTNTFDLLIFDVMLPGTSGFELIKCADGTPVIYLTAKSDLQDRIRGLSLGADDYIVKPFAISELLARVQAVLRRTKRDEMFYKLDGLSVDYEQRKVYVDGVLVELSVKEFSILDLFITNRNIVLSREKIVDAVWGLEYDGESLRVVDVYIQHLRSKLHLKNRLRSVYGMGYRLEV